ncbi:MAG: AAA family ATPase [Anaerolineales bacterium]|nr:AAA family ATPase [Anaerolineales bacterium]
MTGLTLIQRRIAEAPLDARLFVCGAAGTGKTTAAVERMRFLLEQGVPADSILLLAPQRTLQEPYLDLLQSPQRSAGGDATSATVGGLARRMCDLFWPLVAESAGFRNPDQAPIFLTLETAQYYMAHLVRPLIEEQGYFESVVISRNRLYAQILDNLNKAAVAGFPHTQIGERLDAAWLGDPAQRRVYADAQECANRFRQYCLDHNLLDFSLQLEIFNNLLWRNEQARTYLVAQYRHLIYDNVEEDIALAHDLVREWMPNFDSALLLYDENAGYRKFLGGDPVSAYELQTACDEVVELDQSFVASTDVTRLANALTAAIDGQSKIESGGNFPLEFMMTHFHPQMLDEVVHKIQALLADGTPPSEIVILAPYLSDSLRFSIAHRLESAQIAWRSSRPSRSLRDETASKALLTFAALAHPQWNVRPTKFDVAHAFAFALDADLIRAQLLTEIVYRRQDLRLGGFAQIKTETQERITYAIGERYETLRQWLENYRGETPPPLDFFLRRLFGEILSQPDFGFHANLDAIRVAASLVESIKKFRAAMESAQSADDGFDLGLEYIAMLQDGVIAAQYLESWRDEETDAVLIAPAYTFLMMNRPAAFQFWLEPGSDGWSQRVSQPLTHPYVLSRNWEAGRLWTDADEVAMETETLTRLVGGLLARCRTGIVLALSELGVSGFEQRGRLLRAFQKTLQGQAE